MPEPTGTDASKAPGLGRFVPILVLICGLVLFFLLDLDRFLDFQALKDHHEWLTDQVGRRPIVAPLVFGALYAVVTAFSIPGGAFMTIVGGFLFGTVTATISVLFGATLGAVCVFLAARTAFRDLLRAKAGRAMERMEAGFRENAFTYLLVLRLVPLFPFWLVNLVPAFLGVPLRTYIAGTFLGIIPGSLVYASLGNGLGVLLAAGEEPDLAIIFDPEILLPILALAALALAPVVYRRLKARRTGSG